MSKFVQDFFAQYWNAFCDSDHGLLPPDFTEDAEREGLIELVPVTKDALSESFAAERGIEKGGLMWTLTETGRERIRGVTS